jgi:hypothetical protein
MSANQVSDTHIHALVTAMLELTDKGGSTRATCQEFREERERAAYLGNLLTRANIESVNYRYKDSRADVRDSMCSDPADWPPYEYRIVPWISDMVDPTVRLVRVLALLDCYEYQACEPPDWDTSPAAKECDRLRALVCAALRKLHVGDLWSITDNDRNVFTAPQVKR